MKIINKNMKSKAKLHGFFRGVHIRNGKVIDDSGWIPNIITDTGLAQLALVAGDASAVPFTYLAVGSSSTAVANNQTALVAEISTAGLSRIGATVSRVTTTVSNDTLQLYYEFSVSDTISVEEVGVFNAASSGTMLARALTGTKSFVNGDKYQVTYKVSFADDAV